MITNKKQKTIDDKKEELFKNNYKKFRIIKNIIINIIFDEKY